MNDKTGKPVITMFINGTSFNLSCRLSLFGHRCNNSAFSLFLYFLQTQGSLLCPQQVFLMEIPQLFKLKSQFFRRNLVHSIAKMKPNCPVDLFSLEFYHTHLCTLSSLSICPVGLSYQSFPGFCNPQPILVEYILSVLAITSYFKGNIFRCLYCQNLSFSACCTETKFCW